MSCERIVGADGKTMGFICTRIPRPPCELCGSPATILCDYPLSGSKAGQTCNKAMCRKCAVQVDVASLPEVVDLGERPGVIPGGPADRIVLLEGDTTDVCPAHARYIRAKQPSNEKE